MTYMWWFTAKVLVSNFKVERSENLDNAFYVFYVFLKWQFKKRKKSRFLDLKNVTKRILELWWRETGSELG